MLDTNAFSALMAGAGAVGSVLADAREILVPPFVLGELEAGFRHGNRYKSNRDLLARFMAKPGVLEVSAGRQTAVRYGEIKDALRKAGTPIPANDIWIAASALENGAMLVTYDRHFSAVKNLRTWPEHHT
jgi:tRNA(fMet)-specific endonuclease VapC